MEWLNTDYNHGNNFDGTYFTAPERGIYSFNVTARQIFPNTHGGTITLYVNGLKKAQSKQGFKKGNSYGTLYRGNYSCGDSYSDGNLIQNGFGNISLQTKLDLKKYDKVSVEFIGYFFDLNDPATTYFEGIIL